MAYTFAKFLDTFLHTHNMDQSKFYGTVSYFTVSALRSQCFVLISLAAPESKLTVHLCAAFNKLMTDQDLTEKKVAACVGVIVQQLRKATASFPNMAKSVKAVESGFVALQGLWRRIRNCDQDGMWQATRRNCDKVSVLVESSASRQGVGKETLLTMIDRLQEWDDGESSPMSASSIALYVQLSLSLPTTLMVFPPICMRGTWVEKSLCTLHMMWFEGSKTTTVEWCDPACLPLLYEWVNEGVITWQSIVEKAYEPLAAFIGSIVAKQWQMGEFSALVTRSLMRAPPSLLMFPFGQRYHELLSITPPHSAFSRAAEQVCVKDMPLKCGLCLESCGNGQIVPFLRKGGHGICAKCACAIVQNGNPHEQLTLQMRMIEMLALGMLGPPLLWDGSSDRAAISLPTSLRNVDRLHESECASHIHFHTLLQAVVEGRKSAGGALPFGAGSGIDAPSKIPLLKLPEAGVDFVDLIHIPCDYSASLLQQLTMLPTILECTVCVPLLHWHHCFMRASVLMRVCSKRKKEKGSVSVGGKVNVLATAALHMFSRRDALALTAVGPAFVLFEAYSAGGSCEGLCPPTEQAAAMVLDHLLKFTRPGIPSMPTVWSRGEKGHSVIV